MKKFIIETIQARTKDGEKLIFAEGINDMYTFVQPIIPIEYFSEEEKLKMGNPEAGYPWRDITDHKTGSINLGEQEAKDHFGEYDLFILEIKYIEI